MLKYHCNMMFCSNCGGVNIKPDYEYLNQLLNLLCLDSNIHICIHDISGLLEHTPFKITWENKIHSKPFCVAAKSTARGNRLCLACKMLANKKAIHEKAIFFNHCPYGIFEIVRPVEINGSIHCIIYIGNMMLSEERSLKGLAKAGKLAGLPQERLLGELCTVQNVIEIEPYINMAEVIASYIILLHKYADIKKDSPSLHWAVSTARSYIYANYSKNISLGEIAKLYFINEKHLGRIFKKQIGISFNEYLNKVRLEAAEDMLRSSNENVLQIALSCGYQSASYFNRRFKKKNGYNPTEYRGLP